MSVSLKKQKVNIFSSEVRLWEKCHKSVTRFFLQDYQGTLSNYILSQRGLLINIMSPLLQTGKPRSEISAGEKPLFYSFCFS